MCSVIKSHPVHCSLTIQLKTPSLNHYHFCEGTINQQQCIATTRCTFFLQCVRLCFHRRKHALMLQFYKITTFGERVVSNIPDIDHAVKVNLLNVGHIIKNSQFFYLFEYSLTYTLDHTTRDVYTSS